MLLAPRGPRALAVSSDQGTGALWERAAGSQLQAPGAQSARGAGAVAHKGNPSPRRPAPRKHSPRSADSRDSGTRRGAAQSSLPSVSPPLRDPARLGPREGGGSARGWTAGGSCGPGKATRVRPRGRIGPEEAILRR